MQMVAQERYTIQMILVGYVLYISVAFLNREI